MADKAFLVDTTKCIGCKSCQVACKQWNNLPAEGPGSFFDKEYTYPMSLSEITFNHVIFSEIKVRDDQKPVWQIMHKKCFHCENPNCMAVCPTGAISKKDCWVVIDQEKCIGCGECEKACIYNVPHVSKKDYNEFGTGRFISRDKAYKCHACTTNYRDTPACVSTCPTGALSFDHRIKIVERAKKRRKEILKEFPEASIYGLEQFGGLHVITILKHRPRESGLEQNPEPVKSGAINRINQTYKTLSLFVPNIPVFKRFALKISKIISQRA